jgi:hypothetical protein
MMDWTRTVMKVVQLKMGENMGTTPVGIMSLRFDISKDVVADVVN